MQISLNWLKDFVEIPKTLTAEELGLRLTMHTVEIDGIKKQADKLDGVVVGEILEIKKHPNADKLSIAQVDVGEKKPRQIVFGQMLKIEVGYKLPVALAPTVLPSGQKIKKTKLRGEISEGMFCLDQELGLSKDGISAHFFDKKIKNGISIIKILELDDVIFEVDNKSITNRPDLWSHYGMAREIGAFLNCKFKLIKNTTTPASTCKGGNSTPLPPLSGGKLKLLSGERSRIKVIVEDFGLCPRYMAVALTGVKIESSPKWLSDRLIAIGLRPINNIVDITNYVMFDLGQPLHSFDFEKIKSVQEARNKKQETNKFQNINFKFQTNSKKIIIRCAKDGEAIKTLDGEERKLDSSMLVIADNEKPIAIAGVMGGANSEISDSTNAIIIESANFNFLSVRKTAQKLGLRSESSMRFEKSLDPNFCETAIVRAIELIKKVCPKAKVDSDLVDIKKFNFSQGSISLDLTWLEKRIGQPIGKKRVKEILLSLGFVIKDKGNVLQITAPTWRATRDITIAEDIVEEVARIYGYNNLKPAMPKVELTSLLVNQERLLERKIKNILSVGAGLTEVYNYSFTSEEQIDRFGLDKSLALKLANPIVNHQTMLRQNLFCNLCGNIKYNQAKENFIAIYEIGSIFLNSIGDIAKNNKGGESDKLPYQEKHLAIVLAGLSTKISINNNNLFQQAKSVIAYLLNYLNCEVSFAEAQMIPVWADSGIYASIEVFGKSIGWIGKLSPKIASSLSIKKETVVIEISLAKLFLLIGNQPALKYQELSKFPPVVRDLAFVINEKMLYNDIKQEIINFNPLIKQVELFDVYQGNKLGLGKKSLAWHLTYQADRTLTSLEVDKVQSDLIKQLEKKLSAQIRDF
ncbi:MAG: phenylalanine--tRNA ligase subunit beta [Patescibacteria group bacterium]